MKFDLNTKAKIFIKHFLLVLFIGYYLSISLFYHTHLIDGKEISHSHFYWSHKDSNGNPVKHSHSKKQLLTIHVISHFVTTAALGFMVLGITLFLLYQLLVPLKAVVINSTPRYGYSLRAPPSV